MNKPTPIFALVTPFNADLTIDYGAMKAYLAFLSERGGKRVIVSGTTGEFSSLTIKERSDLLLFVKDHYDGEIIHNISASNCQDCITLAKVSDDPVLLLPPYYFSNTSEAGVSAFFHCVLQQISNPVYLYNFPAHSQVNISHQLLAELKADFPKLVGIKDSSGNTDTALLYKEQGAGLEVYTGADFKICQHLNNQLDGIVSGGATPFPELVVDIHRHFAAGCSEGMQRTQDVLDRWNNFRSRYSRTEIPLVKATLGHRIPGFPAHVRPPLVAYRLHTELTHFCQSFMDQEWFEYPYSGAI